MKEIESHPEFSRARSAIEEALAGITVEQGDLRSFASALLCQAAALYAEANGTTGPEGLPVALAKIAATTAARDAHDFEAAKFGPGGRA